jgi:hypothetical protein
MKVYHGSYIAVTEIDLSKSRPRKDFGRGFYVTSLREQAEYWAERMAKRKHTKGVVSEFDFKEYVSSDMKLNVLRFEGYTEDWLDFIVLNRTNESDNEQVHDYDIVEGNVADDAVAARVFEYLNGMVSKEDFLEELKHKAPNHQICFCTVQSLQALISTNNNVNIKDIKIMHIDNDIIQSLMLEFGKNEAEATDIYYISDTYARLADESAELYKKPWQEIYEMLKAEIS